MLKVRVFVLMCQVFCCCQLLLKISAANSLYRALARRADNYGRRDIFPSQPDYSTNLRNPAPDPLPLEWGRPQSFVINGYNDNSEQISWPPSRLNPYTGTPQQAGVFSGPLSSEEYNSAPNDPSAYKLPNSPPRWPPERQQFQLSPPVEKPLAYRPPLSPNHKLIKQPQLPPVTAPPTSQGSNIMDTVHVPIPRVLHKNIVNGVREKQEQMGINPERDAIAVKYYNDLGKKILETYFDVIDNVLHPYLKSYYESTLMEKVRTHPLITPGNDDVMSRSLPMTNTSAPEGKSKSLERLQGVLDPELDLEVGPRTFWDEEKNVDEPVGPRTFWPESAVTLDEPKDGRKDETTATKEKETKKTLDVSTKQEKAK